MKRTMVIFLLTLSIVISACGNRQKDEKKDTPARKVQKLNIDLDTEKKYQEAADKGFQPWKRDAVEVAKECLINTGTGASRGECQILSEDPTNTVIRVNTKDGRFKVSLKRLVKPDGIWTATEIEKEE